MMDRRHPGNRVVADRLPVADEEADVGVGFTVGVHDGLPYENTPTVWGPGSPPSGRTKIASHTSNRCVQFAAETKRAEEK